MKFFHISDLHFGKMLHNIPLVETDQPFWVEAFLRKVDEHEVDAVVIAGDVYDRRVAPAQALQLFARLLTELAERGVYVFVIPGNHDSAARLSHVNELLTSHHIYIAGELRKQLTHVTVPGKKGGPDVTFWLMPYLFPKLVSDEKVLGRPDLSTYDEAARALISAQEIDPEGIHLLAAHQNVLAGGTAPEHSGSETFIGGLGEIDVSAFDAFDYVALGHIHNAQRVGRETVRYAGCPMYYDFSELHRKKDLTLVTIHAKDDIRIDQIPVPLRHTLVQKTGTLKDLLLAGENLPDKDSCYVQCILCEEKVPPRTIEQLRAVYGDCLVNVKRSLPEHNGASDDTLSPEQLPSLSLPQQFTAFYQEQMDELPDADQEELVRRILEQQTRRGSDYLWDAKYVPEKDSLELIDFLEKLE